MIISQQTDLKSGDNQATSGIGPWLYVPLILTASLLQKLALPGTGNALPAGTVIMPILVAVALLAGKVHIDALAFLYFCLFLVCAGFSLLVISPGNEFSVLSLILLCCLQLPLATRPADERSGCAHAQQFYSTLLLILSIIGVIQFASQWLVPRPWSFPVDYYLPSYFRLSTYNNLIPLQYGATKLKSNGVFFAEPSFFGQAIALGAIIEISNRRRPLRIAWFLAGLFVSYSGTGIMVLLPFGLYSMLRGRSLLPLVICSLAALILVLFGNALNIDAITSRINEVSTPGTSGYARFVSVFSVIQRYQLDDLQATMFGIGSGQISRFLKFLPIEGFGPTWSKVFFEYGAVGSAFYTLFLTRLASRIRSPIRLPILFTYLFLGGYLGDANVVIPLLLFVCWSSRTTTSRTLLLKNALIDHGAQCLPARDLAAASPRQQTCEDA